MKPAFVEEKTSLKQNKNLFNLVEKYIKVGKFRQCVLQK